MTDGSYERATQLLPAAAALAPVSCLVVFIFQIGDPLTFVRSLAGVIVTAGLHLIAARTVRDKGNVAQEYLWKLWDGKPTTRSLRWRSGTSSNIERLHIRVQARTGVSLPSRAEEEADPAAADDAYSDATGILREMTRDHTKFPRIWAELKHYGAARNMYGIRRVAVLIASIVAAFSLFLTILSWTDVWSVSWWKPAAVTIVAGVLGAVWLWCISSDYVRIAAERYSDALLAAAAESRDVDG